MIKLKMTIAAVLAGAISAFAQNVADRDIDRGSTTEAVELDGKKYEVKYKTAEADGHEFRFRDVTTTAGGELEKLLGDDIISIDSLIVRGPVNEADFRTMWLSTYKGRTSVINLENAVVENGILPESAFWRNEQLDLEEGYYYSVKLRRIILPEGLKEIGGFAFFCSMKLKDVNIPSTLQSIGECAFHWCRSLWWETLIFPEGIETIGDGAFQEAYYICDNIVLPASLRSIGDLSFYAVRVKTITIPEGLETIGKGALSGTLLSELILPESCVNLAGESYNYGSGAFQSNIDLEKLHLSDNITTLPERVAKTCYNLKEVNIPKSVKTIEKEAFLNCYAIENIDLPEGLETIEAHAFHSCQSHKRIVLPSTLKFLGSESCADWQSCAEIYCKATVPPVCEFSGDKYPFGTYETPDWNETGTRSDIKHNGLKATLYVPKGCLDTYKWAAGWNTFFNIVELDIEDFPAGVDEVTADSHQSDGKVYDIQGRAVNKMTKGQLYIRDGKKFIAR